MLLLAGKNKIIYKYIVYKLLIYIGKDMVLSAKVGVSGVSRGAAGSASRGDAPIRVRSRTAAIPHFWACTSGTLDSADNAIS